MAYNLKYAKKEDIPTEEIKLEDLYTEINGEYVFTGVTGIKTQADIDRLQASLTKERTEHKATKERLRTFADMNDEQLKEATEKLDKYDELETAAKGKIDQAEMDRLVEARIKTRIAPIEREKNELAGKVKEYETTIGDLTAKEKRRIIREAAREAGIAAKIRPTAFDDALDLAERIMEVGEDGKTVTVRDQVGFTPGIDPKTWFAEIQPKREHWWPESKGGGAPGTKPGNGALGENPWTKENWNLTKQGQYYNTHGAEKAEQAAKAAGSKIGATAPPSK